MGYCSFFKFRRTITHTYSRFRVQALHIHTLMLESNYTAYSSDQNSPSTGPESHTALMTLKTVLSLTTDAVLAKWSAIIFTSWEQLNWSGSPRSSGPPDRPADALLASGKWRPSLVRTRRSPRSWRPLGTSLQPCILSHIAVNQNTLLVFFPVILLLDQILSLADYPGRCDLSPTSLPSHSFLVQ